MISALLTAAILTALWVAAWLHWTFNGEVRQFLFAFVLPASWRSGRSREDVASMTQTDMETFLAIESAAPHIVNGALSCPGCLSAHLSVSGTAFAWFALVAPQMTTTEWLPAAAAILAIPLVWSAGAWIGHRLYSHF